MVAFTTYDPWDASVQVEILYVAAAGVRSAWGLDDYSIIYASIYWVPALRRIDPPKGVSMTCGLWEKLCRRQTWDC